MILRATTRPLEALRYRGGSGSGESRQGSAGSGAVPPNTVLQPTRSAEFRVQLNTTVELHTGSYEFELAC